jgi:hypothetical protein
MGWLEEATFGTPSAETGNYEQLEGAKAKIDYGVFTDDSQKDNGMRMDNESNIYVSQTGGIRTITLSDIVLRHKDLANFLYLVTQNVSEGASTPFQKTFTLTSTTTQPAFGSNEGLFMTFGIKRPIASIMPLFTSCICSELTLTGDLVGGDGRLRANATLISGYAANNAANFTTGTWAYNATPYWNMKTINVKKIGGADVVLYAFSITIKNNAVRFGQTTLGNCEGFILPKYEVTGSITTKWDANTQAFDTDGINATSRAIQISMGAGTGVDGYFDITLADCIFKPIPELEYERTEGVAIIIPFKANYDTSGASAQAVFSVADAMDRAW